GSADVQHDILPDAGATVAYARDPIPPFRAKEGGAVKAHGTAVRAGAGLERFLVGNARMGNGRDANDQSVGLAGADEGGNIEHAAHEGAADFAQAGAVEPDVGRVIDAVKREGERPAGEIGRHRKLVAVPIVQTVQ